MTKAISITVTLFASAGWVWLAWKVLMAFEDQIPLTMNETIITIIALLITAFILLMGGLERLVSE